MMKIIDYAKALNRKSTKNNKNWGNGINPLYIDSSPFEDFKFIENLSNFHNSNLSSTFWKAEKQLAKRFDSKIRDEIFYSLKIGKVYKNVPSALMYFIKCSIDKYGSPNYFLYITPSLYLSEFSEDGYLQEGVSITDVIREITGREDYSPLAKGNYKSRTSEDFTDLYIESKDAIAIVPTSLADRLSYEDIKEIRVSDDELVLGDTKIATYIGLAGLTQNTYDFRKII